MIRSGLFWLSIGVLAPASTTALADGLSETAATAAVCSGCHSAETSQIPRINGLSGAAIAESLRTARTSETVTVMNRLARGLSDEEIDAIASYLGAAE